MKVLQVSTHLNVGGIGNYILSLSAMLKKKGLDVIVASSGGNLEGKLSRYGIPHRGLDIDTKFEFSPKVFSSAVRISGIVKKEGVDIIHAHSRVSQAASLFASMISGVPFVTTCHGYFKKRSRGVFDTWGKKVIAISDAVKIHLKDDLGVSEKRTELIYNGVDIDRFSRRYLEREMSALRKELGMKDGPVIGTVGRLSSIKGQRFLIQAMRDVISHVPDAQCLIVGSGDEEFNLKGLARSRGLEDSIYFVPSHPETQKFLAIMDVFVFPSVQEGLGIALLEALASGKACVASRAGGISNVIVNGSNGMLVDVGDVPAISKAVLSLLKNPDLRKEMGSRGMTLVTEKFTLNSMAERIIELYGKVLRR